MTARRRRRIGALVSTVLACALLVPSAQAVTPAQSAYALSDGALVTFDPAAPGNASSAAILGVGAGETLVGIDVRPQNGVLYGLGVNAPADTATLYAISPETGVAAAVGGAIGLTTNGATPVDLPDAGYGFDFSPAADRVRVTSSQGVNFRVNPNNGSAVDGDNTGLTTGVVAGTNPDGPIANAGATVNGTAYTNNRPNNGSVTTLYTLSSTTDQLAVQNPPNTGTQTLAKEVELAGTPLNFSAVGGFDVDSSVNAPANNAAVAAGVAYAVLTVGATNRLYRIDLVDGAATELGAIGAGTAPIQGLALQRDVVDAGYPVVALAADRASLVRFQTATLGTSTTVGLGALAGGETLAAIAWRPQTGQLYGLGVNDTANNATLYVVDPQTAILSAVGAPGQIAFVNSGGATVDFSALTAGWGIDFNPTTDRVRVVAGGQLNFRANPVTGAPVDGNLGVALPPAGTNPDGPHNGFDPGATGVAAVAYTNSYGQSLTGGVTTQYVLEPTSDRLYIQSPPNLGTLTSGKTVTAGGSPLDFGTLAGLDLPPEVRVTTSNVAATGTGIAVLRVAGVSRIYNLDLETAVATGGGAAPTELANIAVGRASATLSLAQPGGGDPPAPHPTPPLVQPAPTKDSVKPKVAKLAIASAKKRKVTVTFTSSEAGTAAVTFLRETKGRRKGKACKPKATRGKRCTVRKAYGTIFKRISAAGKVTIKVEGKVGDKPLKPGGLRVEVTVRDTAGNRSAKLAKSAKVKR